MNRTTRIVLAAYIISSTMLLAILLGIVLALVDRVEELELKPCLLSGAHYHDR